MAFSKNQALALIAQNIPQHQVASTLGVEESYVSQIASDEENQEELERLRLQYKATAEKVERFDELLEKTEEVYLENIAKRAPLANLQQSLQAFRVLTGARRRRETTQAPAGVNAAISVNITMPVQVLPAYVKNAQNEIVEVNGQTMVSATAKDVDRLLEIKTGIRRDQNKRAEEVITNLQSMHVKVPGRPNVRSITLDDL